MDTIRGDGNIAVIAQEYLSGIVGSIDEELTFVYGVTVSGNRVFAISGYSKLQVLDTSFPRKPVISGHTKTRCKAEGIVVRGNHAYICDGSSLSILRAPVD